MLTVPATVGCQFSFSSGGPDYTKLETSLTEDLNKEYEPMSLEVSSVDCPRPAQKPEAGDTFNCIADLAGNDVRVEVTVADEDYNVDYSTIDVVYDLSDTSTELSGLISEDLGFTVTVSCGTGIRVVEAGSSFECEAADRRGDTKPVRVTAGGVDEDDRWEIID